MSSYTVEVHASPSGSPLGDGSLDYPTRTIDEALAKVRLLRTNPYDPAIIWLHEGCYPLSETLTLEETDSSLTVAAYRKDGQIDAASISGAQNLTAWREDSINGKHVWTHPIPSTSGRSLYVKGTRIPKPRFPHTGMLKIAEQPELNVEADLNATLFQGSSSFLVNSEELRELHDVAGVEAVIPHFWIQERLPLKSLTSRDDDRLQLDSDYSTMLCLKEGDGPQMASFYLEGVAEKLGEQPGEWLADFNGSVVTDSHPKGYGEATALYVPAQEDDLTSFSAQIPLVGQLVRLSGKEPHHDIHDVRFDSVTFEYADWHQAPSAQPPFQMREDPQLDPNTLYASDPQAASSLPGVIDVSFATNCSFTSCSFEHLESYGIRLGRGCKGTLISSCSFFDLGAGAVNCGGDATRFEPGFNHDNEVSDCTISHGGRTYPHCVALLFRHGAHNTITFNEISDFFSSAIACGWKWDYEDNDSTDNLIEGNHLHHLGYGFLNWFGAIYTLGVSPRTEVKNNLIHDVSAASFGGWGILADPASSCIVFSGNVIHSVSSECFHLKTGSSNIVVNNLFAYGTCGQFSQAVPENHISGLLSHNVMVGENTAPFATVPGSAPSTDYSIVSDANLFWDTSARQNLSLSTPHDGATPDPWREKGHDLHSVISDPGLELHDDGSVSCDTSVLTEHGISPFFSGVQGPRTHSERVVAHLSQLHPSI